MENQQASNWFITKNQDGTCQIISLLGKSLPQEPEFWGPFASAEAAIARRVGLIRAGKCQPQ